MMDYMAFMQAMGSNSIPFIAAFFIGLMTALSPCPLATNITAIAYISKNIEENKHTLRVGLIYTLGRSLAYILVASGIVFLGVGSQTISFFLQKNGEMILGPFLLLAGLLMLFKDRLPLPQGDSRVEQFREKLGRNGYLGGFFLGFLFALSFCPFSAVLFFGMLIPLSISEGDAVILPAIFAFATGLPVIISAMMLSHGVKRMAKTVNRIQGFQDITHRVVGVIFFLAGLYYMF